jgi:hypothetical protein
LEINKKILKVLTTFPVSVAHSEVSISVAPAHRAPLNPNVFKVPVSGHRLKRTNILSEQARLANSASEAGGEKKYSVS